MMSNEVLKVEVMPECCCICGLSGELATPEEYDAASGSAAPLRTALLHLNNNKVVPEGRLCGSCAQRAIDAHDFATSLSTRTAAPLSEKIRALRRRLHDLTQKIDVFIVVGGPGASGTYSEEDIIMVERGALAAAEQQPPVTNAKGDHVYQCSVCPMSFPTVEQYSSHIASHPPSSQHCCWSCGAQFPDLQQLQDHQAQHQVDDTTCHLCQTSFKSSLQLRTHISGGVCAACPLCGEEKASRAEMSSHATFHNNLCPVCFLVLPDEEALAGHTLSHRSSRRFVCAVGSCVLRFTKREHLLAHLRRQHQTEAKEETSDWACEQCPRTFGSQAALRRHARVHKDEELVQMQEEFAAEKVEGEEEAEGVEYTWGEEGVVEGVEGEEVEYLEMEALEEEVV